MILFHAAEFDALLFFARLFYPNDAKLITWGIFNGKD